MNEGLPAITRRWFLKAFAPCLGMRFLGLPHVNGFNPPSQIDAKTIKELRAKLLQLVNEERSLAKVPTLEIDELASRVGTEHALDMVKGKFASHWGSNGLKPYHRYSFAGGIHAIEENISATDRTWSLEPADIAQDVSYMHVRLYGESPPNDGHRRSILAPQHTHVGFGIATEDLRLRVVEIFVAKYLEVSPVKQQAKPGATFELSGKLLKPNHALQAIEIFYEPEPKPPQITWLRTVRPYSLPDESVTLWPKLPRPLMYSDGSRGVIEFDADNFRAPVTLFKKTAGIYTIVCWIRKIGAARPFSATEICIRAE